MAHPRSSRTTAWCWVVTSIHGNCCGGWKRYMSRLLPRDRTDRRGLFKAALPSKLFHNAAIRSDHTYNSGLTPDAVPLAMIVLDGRSALSDFRLDRLNQRIGQISSKTRVRGARHVYFVEPRSQ